MHVLQLHYFRGREFRKSFGEIGDLKSFFPHAPFLCLSGTLMLIKIRELSKLLNMKNPCIISSSPDVGNIFYSVLEKGKGDVTSVVEEIYLCELEKLKQEGSEYPVTLMYMPLQYMSHAMRAARKMFTFTDFDRSLYAALFSNQDPIVVDHIMSQLKLENPHLRLIFCTSVIGMGFDSPSVTNVIHVKPPRNLSNYSPCTENFYISILSYPTSYIQHPTSSILHPTSSILHPASYILHPASYILHPASYIQHPASYIQHPT